MKHAIRQDSGHRTVNQNLRIFATAAKGLPMEEALRRVNAAGLVLASLRRVETLLLTDAWLDFTSAFTCWSGTMVGYDIAGRKLGESIVYESEGARYVFPVPERYRGMKDAALVAEHPNFTLAREKKDRIVQAAETNVGVVENFPAHGQGTPLYKPGQRYGIPAGAPVGPDTDGVFLSRLGASRVGLAPHVGMNVFFNLSEWPSERLGVIVEAPAAAARK
jgi:hypothetical protein